MDAPPTRRQPDLSYTIRLGTSAEIDALIDALRSARKRCRNSGGCRTVTIHDHADQARRVHLDIDLTHEIFADRHADIS